ncbi:putative nicalin-1-like [Sesbania bispinosa]|nr:putative nicalin-1-like [Sesbania bispinosa]
MPKAKEEALTPPAPMDIRPREQYKNASCALVAELQLTVIWSQEGLNSGIIADSHKSSVPCNPQYVNKFLEMTYVMAKIN